MKIKINALIGMLEDAFNEMAFTSVKINYTDRYDHDLEENLSSVHIGFEARRLNPNKDKPGKYLTAKEGFHPLTTEEEGALNYGDGLELKSVKRVIEEAKTVICNYGKQNGYRAVVL